MLVLKVMTWCFGGIALISLKKFQEHCLFKREPGKIIVKLYCIICIHKYTFERLTGSLSLNVHIYIYSNV